MSTRPPTRLSRALPRAIRTATGSMSLATTGRRSTRAAAMARTPVPVPTSRILFGLASFTIRSSARRQPRVVAWWPVPKASPASISIAMRFAATRPRSCEPCTTNRPAPTGVSPSRLALTQSLAAVVSNTSALAASGPAASPMSARTAVSFGGSRKWMATVQRSGPSSLAPTAVESWSKLSATTSMRRRAVAASVASRAAVLASDRSAGIDGWLTIPVAHSALYTGCRDRAHRLLTLAQLIVHRPIGYAFNAPSTSSANRTLCRSEPRRSRGRALSLSRSAVSWPRTHSEDEMARRRILFALFTALTMAALAAPAAAQSVADFYRGKTITMAVGTSPGGDYDLRMRMVGRHIGKHIPGNPTVIATNMPGAGQMLVANWLAGVAPKDGTVIAAISQNLVVHQATAVAGIKYDVREFNWIGNTTDTPNVITSWHATGIRTIQDVMQRELVVGATGIASGSYLYPHALNTLVGTKFKIVTGYPGGNDVNLAMERGEVGGRGSNSWASWKSTRPQWLAEKKIFILAQVGVKRKAELPDVPTLLAT